MFIKTVSELAYGGAVGEYDAALRDLVAACIETRKGGTFTLTLKVEPDRAGGTQVTVSDAFKVSRPEHDRLNTIFYVQRDGSLGRRDPRQPELPMREVARETRIDTETGEVSNG